MGGHGVVIHADENQLTRNIFPFPSNVKGDYMLLIPNSANQTHLSTKYTLARHSASARRHERARRKTFFAFLRVTSCPSWIKKGFDCKVHDSGRHPAEATDAGALITALKQ
jgi:hypothetical protein